MNPVDSLRELLEEMRSMIEHIDDESYTAPARRRSGGGIGGHVRHCLDHVSALVAGTRTGLCAYDRRARGTAVETRRLAALHCILDLEADLLRLNSHFDVPVDVETQVDTEGAFLVTTSTIGRELLFVINHTIHHNALIAHLLDERAIDMGPRFGLAPATPVLACAR